MQNILLAYGNLDSKTVRS